jgi:Transposase IS116/IS110/IS902 family
VDHEMASLLSQHQDAVQRLAEVPGLGADSVQQIIAEVASPQQLFLRISYKQLSSWVGACPGDEESAGVSKNHRSLRAKNPIPKSIDGPIIVVALHVLASSAIKPAIATPPARADST